MRVIGSTLYLLLLCVAPFSYAERPALPLFIVTGDARNPIVSDPSHPKGGKVPEQVRAIVEHMGYDAQIGFFPWMRAIHVAQQKETFGLFPASKNLPEIDRFLLVPRPLYELPLTAVVPRNSRLREVKKDEATRLSTCELMGAETYKKLGLKVIEVKEGEQCLRLLEAGRIDFLMLTDDKVRKLMATGSYRIVKDDLGYRPRGYFLINKAYPRADELYEKFSAAFQELEANGTLRKIRDKYPSFQSGG